MGIKARLDRLESAKPAISKAELAAMPEQRFSGYWTGR